MDPTIKLALHSYADAERALQLSREADSRLKKKTGQSRESRKTRDALTVRETRFAVAVANLRNLSDSDLSDMLMHHVEVKPYHNWMRKAVKEAIRTKVATKLIVEANTALLEFLKKHQINPENVCKNALLHRARELKAQNDLAKTEPPAD